MTSKTISAENLGPITALEFALTSPGVTVLVAPNGSGKTILLEAVQAAARGEGKLPLRDRTKKGKVEAFGATVTIGGTCRHTGSFEVTNLEGRVQPGLDLDLQLPNRGDTNGRERAKTFRKSPPSRNCARAIVVTLRAACRRRSTGITARRCSRWL